MTKYILHGGYLGKATDAQNSSFCHEIIKDFKLERPIRILVCMFARPIDEWQVRFEGIEQVLRQYLKNITVDISKPEKFIQQVEESDVIFLEGGVTTLLKNELNKYNWWDKNFKEKVLIGTSAGAHIISKYYYGLSSLKIQKGLGLLDIKVISHWDSDYNAPNINWEKALNELKNYKENLPVYTPKEGEYVIIEL